jgi:hypothetical protein
MAIPTHRAVALIISIGFASCATAAAQDVASPAAKNAAYREMRMTCSADTARFCPAIGHVTATPRDQAMCLKTYRVDLSLACRKALAAVNAATETEP